MSERYLPAGEEAQPSSAAGAILEGDETEVDDLPQDSAVDWVADSLWVYQNLVTKQVDPAKAPSRGALGLLKWAQTSPAKFYETYLPKALKRQKRARRCLSGPGWLQPGN
jgi:hypothetical protein